jgi:hypothetical protein
LIEKQGGGSMAYLHTGVHEIAAPAKFLTPQKLPFCSRCRHQNELPQLRLDMNANADIEKY